MPAVRVVFQSLEMLHVSTVAYVDLRELVSQGLEIGPRLDQTQIRMFDALVVLDPDVAVLETLPARPGRPRGGT
jgi:hypothetical protein